MNEYGSWEHFALLKLYLAGADSLVFENLAATMPMIRTAFVAHHEALTAFMRRESEGALPPGEADIHSATLLIDLAKKAS